MLLLGLFGKIKAVATDVSTVLTRLTATRAGYLDNLNGFVASRLDVAVSSIAPRNFQVFTADGTFTWPTGIQVLYITMVGAGAAGGGGQAADGAGWDGG